MRKLKAFIINLRKATVRRAYMENLLSPYSFLDIEFVNAIDGRLLSSAERTDSFDDSKCLSLIGRLLNGGEVGCTLSHRKCYHMLLDSNEPFAVIFEDDISLMRDFNQLFDYDINKVLAVDKPVVLIISGDYWYLNGSGIVSVYDCVGAYAYLINRSAAELILSEKACTVADQWRYQIERGLEIKAIRPYMVDANLKMDILSSDVAQDDWNIHRNKMSKKVVIRGYCTGLIKRILKILGLFESKIRVINNQTVE